jgi:hypothetical protein
MQMTFFLGVLVGAAAGLTAARFLIWPPRPSLTPFEPPPALPIVTARPLTRLTNRNRSVEL